MKKILAAGMILAFLSTPALADKKGDHEETGDPNRIVCKTVKVIGSRLAREKSCHTAAEWADIRRQQRMVAEKVQAFKPSFCGAGSPC